MEKIFFDNWESVIRTIVISLLAYGVLVVQLRVSGKRTLSKMNAFDFIVTVALGSTLATVLLTKDVALVDGLLGFAMLIGLQFLITWLSVRFSFISKLVKSEPVLLLHQGSFLWENMKKERVTREEITAALRAQGIGKLEEAGAVVLETNGTLSVMKNAPTLQDPVFADVKQSSPEN